MIRFTFLIFVSVIVNSFLLTLMSQTVRAQVMQSSNYQVQSDSINFGGGLSSSTNYSQESSFGEVSTGESSSDSFNLYGGYQKMDDVFLSVTSVASSTSVAPVSNVVGGEASVSSDFLIVSNSSAGYQLTIKSENTPAMQSASSTIPDYVTAGADPDYNFNVGVSSAYFGFSPNGPDVVQRFRDNGVDKCNAGANITVGRCWAGLSTTPTVIASSNRSNSPNGANTTIDFKVGIGSARQQAMGNYYATTTITLLSL